MANKKSSGRITQNDKFSWSKGQVIWDKPVKKPVKPKKKDKK